MPVMNSRFHSVFIFLLLSLLSPMTAHADPRTITVTVDTRKPLSTFAPSRSIGAAVDGYEQGDIAKIYTRANVKAMLSAGLEPITYRLRTELGIEAWHWNPRGRWSDPQTKSGYWTSSSTPGPAIPVCHGYALPRRGDTFDQANNSGYSRIDDGDPKTFWKSNPYLSRPFAPEDHPQWILVELPRPTPVDTVRIDWADPYATQFCVQYWSPDASQDPRPAVAYLPGHIDATLYQKGEWRTFPSGTVESGRGGVEEVRLCRPAITVQVIRIVLQSSSGTGPPHSRDIRDRLGYAVRELHAGSTDATGRFHDALRHGRTSQTQTVIYVSSTDPWHRASDLDPDVEQPGFTRIFGNGITRGLPMMIPAGVAYDTPDNAAAEIEYLRRRGYPVEQVEMGEEPDGQYMTPEDYGALYLEYARALHKIDPSLKLGGPCYQTMAWWEAAWDPIPGPQSWGNRSGGSQPGSRSWTRRFIAYLANHGDLKDLAFFSSEFYFFNDVCSPPSPKLVEMPKLVDDAFARWRRDGVPVSIPWYATEFGYSPYAAEPEADLPGALLDADFVGHFLTAGGAGAYFYGIEPNSLIKEVSACDTYGNLALWQSDDDRNIVAPFAAYWVMRLVTREWSTFGSKRNTLYRTQCDSPVENGEPVVTAYAVRHPDGRTAVMLIDKSATEAFRVDVDGLGAGVDIFQYSNRNYAWHANGEHGYASPNRPPDRWRAKSTRGILAPPMSITVVRALVPSPSPSSLVPRREKGVQHSGTQRRGGNIGRMLLEKVPEFFYSR